MSGTPPKWLCKPCALGKKQKARQNSLATNVASTAATTSGAANDNAELCEICVAKRFQARVTLDGTLYMLCKSCALTQKAKAQTPSLREVTEDTDVTDEQVRGVHDLAIWRWGKRRSLRIFRRLSKDPTQLFLAASSPNEFVATLQTQLFMILIDDSDLQRSDKLLADARRLVVDTQALHLLINQIFPLADRSISIVGCNLGVLFRVEEHWLRLVDRGNGPVPVRVLMPDKLPQTPTEVPPLRRDLSVTLVQSDGGGPPDSPQLSKALSVTFGGGAKVSPSSPRRGNVMVGEARRVTQINGVRNRSESPTPKKSGTVIDGVRSRNDEPSSKGSGRRGTVIDGIHHRREDSPPPPSHDDSDSDDAPPPPDDESVMDRRSNDSVLNISDLGDEDVGDPVDIDFELLAKQREQDETLAQQRRREQELQDQREKERKQRELQARQRQEREQQERAAQQQRQREHQQREREIVEQRERERLQREHLQREKDVLEQRQREQQQHEQQQRERDVQEQRERERIQREQQRAAPQQPQQHPPQQLQQQRPSQVQRQPSSQSPRLQPVSATRQPVSPRNSPRAQPAAPISPRRSQPQPPQQSQPKPVAAATAGADDNGELPQIPPSADDDDDVIDVTVVGMSRGSTYGVIVDDDKLGSPEKAAAKPANAKPKPTLSSYQQLPLQPESDYVDMQRTLQAPPAIQYEQLPPTAKPKLQYEELPPENQTTKQKYDDLPVSASSPYALIPQRDAQAIDMDAATHAKATPAAAQSAPQASLQYSQLPLDAKLVDLDAQKANGAAASPASPPRPTASPAPQYQELPTKTVRQIDQDAATLTRGDGAIAAARAAPNASPRLANASPKASPKLAQNGATRSPVGSPVVSSPSRVTTVNVMMLPSRPSTRSSPLRGAPAREGAAPQRGAPGRSGSPPARSGAPARSPSRQPPIARVARGATSTSLRRAAAPAPQRNPLSASMPCVPTKPKSNGNSGRDDDDEIFNLIESGAQHTMNEWDGLQSSSPEVSGDIYTVEDIGDGSDEDLPSINL